MFAYYVVTYISQNEALNVTFKPVHTFKVPFVSEVLFHNSICLWSCIILCECILIAVICVRARLQRVQLPRRVARQYPSYGLYLYGEGAYAQETRGLKLTGAPVLFLPGNAGSYKQGEIEGFPQYFNQYIHTCLCDMNSLALFICLQGGFWLFGDRQPVCLLAYCNKDVVVFLLAARSLGSVALRKAENLDRPIHMNVFTIDFNEELVALYGGSLRRQTQFLHESIKAILRLYKVRRQGVLFPFSSLFVPLLSSTFLL